MRFRIVRREYRSHYCGHPRRNHCRGCRVTVAFRIQAIGPGFTKLVGPRLSSKSAANDELVSQRTGRIADGQP